VGNVIEAHEHAGDFKEWQRDQNVCDYRVSAAHLSTARIKFDLNQLPQFCSERCES